MNIKLRLGDYFLFLKNTYFEFLFDILLFSIIEMSTIYLEFKNIEMKELDQYFLYDFKFLV